MLTLLPTRAFSTGKRLTRLARLVRYYLSVPAIWTYQFFHVAHGFLHVLDLIRFRPLPAGLIDRDHPWVTGRNPATGRPIWPENVVYRSPRSPGMRDGPEDDVILNRVGRFLAAQAARSAVVPEIPWGPRRRMPHAINYMHGAAQYTSGLVLLNDLADGYAHFSDRRFTAEVWRFVRTEQRELLVIFRQRQVGAEEYAGFVAFLRTLFPWFCNSNGPGQRILWGNPSPYPVVNIISGNWMRDIYRLKTPAGRQALLRPPVPAGKYFTDGPYRGDRTGPRWPEKLLVSWITRRIRWRGAKGNLQFVDRRRLLAARLQRLREQAISDEPVAAL